MRRVVSVVLFVLWPYIWIEDRTPTANQRLFADIRKSTSILGWEPRTSFEAGLARTIRWARDEFAAENQPISVTRKGAQ